MYVIGVDLGGTKISTAIADYDGNIIGKNIVNTEAHLGEQHVMNNILNCIDNLLIETDIVKEDIKSIGIGSPGPLDCKKGMIIETPNLPFRNFSVTKPIEEKYNVRAYIQNDANAATLGEQLFGEGKDVDSFIYLTISTGIGGGVVLNKKLYLGTTGNALEVGHAIVKSDGPRCNCGSYGCIEAIASGTGLARTAINAVKGGKQTNLSKYTTLTAREVILEALSGDIVAKEILDEAIMYLGITVANLVAIFDLQKIVIGGGVGNSTPYIIEKVNEVVRTRGFKPMCREFTVVNTALKNDTGVKGAIAVAILGEDLV